MQQLDKSKKAQHAISVPDPVMEYSMYRDRRAKAKLLKCHQEKTCKHFLYQQEPRSHAG